MASKFIKVITLKLYEKDYGILEWLKKQHNVTSSLKYLILKEQRTNGNKDIFQSSLEKFE